MSYLSKPCMMCGQLTLLSVDSMDLCPAHWHHYLNPSKDDRTIAALELGFCGNTATPTLVRAHAEAMDKYPGGALQALRDCRAIRDLGGYTFTTRSTMLWGFTVNKEEVEEDGKFEIPATSVERRMHYEGRRHHNAWFVWLCAGSIKDIWKMVPWEPPYIIFARDNKRVKVYKTSALKRRLESISKTAS